MEINGTEFESRMDFVYSGARCATPDPALVMENRVRRNRRAFQEQNESFLEVDIDITIPVRFIHITDGQQGEVTPETRKQQIEVLNTAYDPSGIRFTYDETSVVTVDNARWYRADYGTVAEREMKTRLIEAPTRQLNFITSSPGGGLLGWATFPWGLPLDPELDSVVVLNESLPGGSSAPYNLGQTATHEVGHWLGLLHTFQGGCNVIGDNIRDTVAHGDANVGTPDPGENNGACDPNEKAPVHNYMNYVDDSHMTEFTNQQNERMRDLTGIFRPELIQSGGAEEMRTRLQEFEPIT